MTRTSWYVLWAAFSTGVVATLVQFAVPPILPLIQSHYQVSYTDTALLMSLFALSTLLSAVPVGFIVQRYGVRTIGLLGIGILFAGVLCSYFADSFQVLLFSRIVQGTGFGLVSVAAPSAIGQFVAPKMMSVAMGIWSTWIPLGSLIMFLFAPRIVSNYQIGAFWIIQMLILVLSFLFYAKFIPKSVHSQEDTQENVSVKLPKDAVKNELKNKNIWWAAGAFATFTFAFFSFNTWISTYLVESSSMALVTASQIPSIVSLLMIGSNLYAGFLLRKLNTNLMVYIMPPLVIAFIWPAFLIKDHVILYGIAVILGLVGGFVPTIVFASAPYLATSRETIGIAMSIVIIGENTGILIGPEVFGIVREYTGDFVNSFWILLFVGLVTVIACYRICKSWVFASLMKKKVS